MNWSKFFAMGGYGVYVWSAYGFALLVLIANALAPLKRRHEVWRKLRRMGRRREFENEDTAS